MYHNGAHRTGIRCKPDEKVLVTVILQHACFIVATDIVLGVQAIFENRTCQFYTWIATVYINRIKIAVEVSQFSLPKPYCVVFL